MTIDDFDAVTHWDARHTGTEDIGLSWYEQRPTTSLELIDMLIPATGTSVIDVGGGVSHLAENLARAGRSVTVLDVSAAAIDLSRKRTAGLDGIDWVTADIRTWEPDRTWDLWHDRALLHFLTDDEDRRRYGETLRSALRPGGAFVLAAFAEDGPTHCSGLEVRRHSAADMRAVVPDADVVDERVTVHVTPAGAEQRFRWLAGRLR